MNVLVPRPGALSKTFPAILQRAGKAACFAADEFFAAKISNPHTRRAYARPVGAFSPGAKRRASSSARNLALAALRHFFDALVTRHAVVLNPFASVRGRQDARADDSASAGVAWLPGPVKRRGAAGPGGAGGADLHRGPGWEPWRGWRRGDLQDQETQRVLRFAEKGGKQREIPVRHDLDAWIAAYLEAGGIDLSPKAAPLFLAAERGGVGTNGSTDDGARSAADAQATAQGCRAAGDHHPAQLSRHGGHRLAGPERAHGERAVPGRALQSPDHPDL